jgi:hypothetical protein
MAEVVFAQIKDENRVFDAIRKSMRSPLAACNQIARSAHIKITLSWYPIFGASVNPDGSF